jgi:hypothetical protein
VSDTPTFAASAYLSYLYAAAPKEEVEKRIEALLRIQGTSTPDLIKELSDFSVTNAGLLHMDQLLSVLNQQRDRDTYANSFAKFAVATTLLKVVVWPNILDDQQYLPFAFGAVMEAGADGLLELGFVQFAALAKLASTLADWVSRKKFTSVTLIESPIGNSLLVQVFCQLLERRGISANTVVLGSRRNDKRSLGQNVDDAVKDCVNQTKDVDCVVLADDVVTGARYIKTLRSLLKRVDRTRFLPIAMIFDDPQRPVAPADRNRDLFKSRIEEQARRVDYPEAWVTFPPLPAWLQQNGTAQVWQDPMIWGYFDVIAGKRKVNLVFTGIEYIGAILEDLAQDNSKYRSYLETAWTQDVGGQTSAFAPGVLNEACKEYVATLDLKVFLIDWTRRAQEAFQDDYKDRHSNTERIDVRQRAKWLRESFVELAQMRLGPERAECLAKAVFCILDASFMDIEPRSSRDTPADHYLLPYHPIVRQLNERIVSRVIEAAEKGWHAPAHFLWRGSSAPS